MFVDQVKGEYPVETFHGICSQRSFFVFFHELPAFLDGVVIFCLPHVAERYLIYIPGSSHGVLAQDCAQEFAPGEPAWSRAGTASTRTSDSKAQWIKWLGGLSVCLDINMRYSIVLVGTFFLLYNAILSFLAATTSCRGWAGGHSRLS